MSDPTAPGEMNSDSRLPGFDLRPFDRGRGNWFIGRSQAGPGGFLVREIAGLPFGDVVRNLATIVDLLSVRPAAAWAAPVAIVVTSGGRAVAGSSTVSSGIRIEVDSARADALEPQSPVDVWVAYDDSGEEVLTGCDVDPRAASGRLGLVAEVLDAMAAGHGALDSVSLRMTPSGPLVLSAGLAALEALARSRYDEIEPWLTVSPERCLPPGLPTAAGDQYGLAVLWAVARTGRPPHDAPTAESLVRAKLTAPPNLEGLEPAERAVLARALRIPAEARFESSTAFARALQDVFIIAPQAAGSPLPLALPPPPSEPSPSEPAPPAPEQESPAFPATGLETTVAVDPHQQLPLPAGTTSLPARSVTGLPGVLAAAPYKTGDLILPGYRLERFLGEGGCGKVWRASAPGGMGVAIKVIGNLSRREGAREFRALRTIKDIRHAHIVPIVGIWVKTADGRLLDEQEASRAGEQILEAKGDSSTPDRLELVVAMGLGDGTLHDQLTRRDPAAPPGLEPGRLLVWMRQAALAIDHFNRGQVRDGVTSTAVQHCDIKPQNMLLVGDVVQVCDFGLARVQGQARPTANNLLSIPYAPPEIVVRPHNPSPTTDQYSLAVSYYELRTGRLPYQGQPKAERAEISDVELLRLITEGAVELSLVSPREQHVLRRALALEPAERFGSCEELVDGLDAAFATDPEPPPPVARPVPGLRVGRFTIAGAVALALGAWLLRPKPPPLNYPQEVQNTLLESLTADGIDPQAFDRARELAAKAGTTEDARRLQAAVEAVDRVAELIASVTRSAPDEMRLDEARAAVKSLPDEVSPPLRQHLNRVIDDRFKSRATDLKTKYDRELASAVRPDGGLLEEHLQAAQKAADSLGRIAPGDGQRLTAGVDAVRAIAAVLGSEHPEPAGVDDAVGRLDRAAADLPPPARERLSAGLAERIITRASRRLHDHELVNLDLPNTGKIRVIADSVKDLQMAIRLAPNSWRARSELGYCESLRGRYREAVEEYGRALAMLDAESAEPAVRDDTLRRRAYALTQLGEFAEAADDYAVFLADDPRLLARLWCLSKVAQERKDYTGAVAVLERLETLMNGNPGLAQAPGPASNLEVLHELAWLLACGFGRDPAARAVPAAENLVRFLRQFPPDDDHVKKQLRNADALDVLAAAYARAGRFAEAVRTSEEALAVPGITEVLQKDYERHRRAFQQGSAWDDPHDGPE